MPEQMRDAFIIIHELKLKGLPQMYFICHTRRKGE